MSRIMTDEEAANKIRNFLTEARNLVKHLEQRGYTVTVLPDTFEARKTTETVL